jgi:hypothetical protein
MAAALSAHKRAELGLIGQLPALNPNRCPRRRQSSCLALSWRSFGLRVPSSCAGVGRLA